MAAVGLVALALLAFGADALMSAGRIHPGVRVGSIAVGGMSTGEAARTIAEAVDAAASREVELTVAGVTWRIEGSRIGLSADTTALAEAAYAVGRGPLGRAVVERASALVGGISVPLELTCDEEALGSVLEAVNDDVGRPARDAAVEVKGTAVERTPPSDGLGLEPKAAKAAVLAAFAEGRDVVELELVSVAPLLDEKDVEDAYRDALAMVSAPVTLYYGDKEWQVAPETIGSWIGFRVVGAGSDAVLEAYVVSDEVSRTVLPMVDQVGRPARNATFKVSSGTVSIVPAQDGLAADAEELALRLTSVLTAGGERRAELTMHRVEPEITTEEAERMGIKERIATFTTDYASSNKPRVNNIHLHADTLNGTLIPPGGVFSFNKTIGPRTAAKGYQEANAIVNGKLVPQLGGGICQIGTTIFNTVFFSGLPVIERHNHSLYISHYPKGRDATISWGGPDFKFKNDTPNWILIATSYTNSSVTISLYGTDPGYEVTYQTGPWTNLVDPPVREIKDPTLPLGSRVVEEKGVSGRTIVVTRTVTKDGVVVRTDTFKSVYRPAEEVVRVGTKKTSSVPTTTTP